MDREGHNEVIYFVGPEVEHTAHFCHKTLFVVGVRSLPQMIEYAEKHKCTHVYLGANQSYQNNKLFNNLIIGLLEHGLRVTLDYPVENHSFVVSILDQRVWQDNNFVPMISCKIEKIEGICKNLVLKVDDIDFNVTNSGVWTKPVNELLDSNRKTEWNEYINDEVILRDSDVKKVEPVNTGKKKTSAKKEKKTTSKSSQTQGSSSNGRRSKKKK